MVYFDLLQRGEGNNVATRVGVLENILVAWFYSIFWLIALWYFFFKSSFLGNFFSKGFNPWTVNGLLYFNLTLSSFHKFFVSYFPSLKKIVYLMLVCLRLSYLFLKLFPNFLFLKSVQYQIFEWGYNWHLV